MLSSNLHNVLHIHWWYFFFFHDPFVGDRILKEQKISKKKKYKEIIILYLKGNIKFKCLWLHVSYLPNWHFGIVLHKCNLFPIRKFKFLSFMLSWIRLVSSDKEKNGFHTWLSFCEWITAMSYWNSGDQLNNVKADQYLDGWQL